MVDPAPFKDHNRRAVGMFFKTLWQIGVVALKHWAEKTKWKKNPRLDKNAVLYEDRYVKETDGW